MWELVQITAQYSNAVLVAVLPHVSDFAQKLNLSVPLPVTANQVLAFRCDPRKDRVGGVVTLTNGCQFTFLDGRVCVYRSPQSYYSLQDPERIPNFYGPVKIKEQQAVKTARGVIKNLGYKDTVFRADKPPRITPPEKIGTNFVARYRFKWTDPNWHGTNFVPALLDVEVNAENRQIEMVSIASRETQRSSPKVDVQPPVIQSAAKPQQQQRSNIVLPSKAFSGAFLEAILPQISDFIINAKLLVSNPVTTNDIDFSRYLFVIDRGIPFAQIYLKNGDRFNYVHGHVAGFYAHDAFFKFPDAGRVEDFFGRKNMGTNDAIALAKEVVKRLGYFGNPVNISFYAPAYIWSDKFTRYFVHFERPNDHSDIAVFEIALESKAIKSIYLDDPSLWREPPKIDLPMKAETNSSPAPNIQMEAPIDQQTLDFVERIASPATNAIRTNLPVKRSNPFE